MRFGGLPQDTEIAIFRIVQEAFTNVHKHSWSKDVIIRAVRSDADVRVEIEDYGKGMPLLSGLPEEMCSLASEPPGCASGSAT